MKRVTLVSLFVLAAACGSKKEEAPEEAPKPRFTCPPCGMQTTPPAEFTEVGDMKFWLCNDRCAEHVRQDPERFREHAIVE